MSRTAMVISGWVPFLGGLACGGAVLSFVLIRILRPWLLRYALARPSARGLHTVPTPQGGGIAVLIACAAVAIGGAGLESLAAGDAVRLGAVLAAAAVLAALGLVDDIRPLPALPRLSVQLLAMAIGVLALPEGTRVLPLVPLGLERGLLIVGGAWFVNLTNFMDGMDWMTVVEMVPLSASIVWAWSVGHVAASPGLIALGLVAGLVGFAPYNKPVARLFLGDVGSLPIGFLAAYGLFSFAGSATGGGSGALIGAVIVVLYYIADSGLTLAWRMFHGQRIWEPHRSHFYQVAVARGLSVPDVLWRVAATNAILCVLAQISVAGSPSAQALALGLACATVGFTLYNLSRGRAAF